MIIWIDGANGVGKSHVAKKLAERLSNINAEYIESDYYWMKLTQDKPRMIYLGFFPYCNKYFLAILRAALEEKMQDFGKSPIVSMSLVDKLCQEELLDYFNKKGVSTIHIILEAQIGTIISRIRNDPIRDISLQNQQKVSVSCHINYLENNYPDAVRINTENKSFDEIVDEIIESI